LVTIRSLIIRVGADISDLQKQLNSAQKTLNKTSRKFTDIGGTLTRNITLPLVASGGAAIKFATDFNASMANIATLIPGDTERINKLKKAVQDMAVETGVSTTDISGGLYQVISAFGDTADTVKILETNVKAAKAGISTTTDAINLTSAVTKGYGDVTSEAVNKATDLAFATVKLGQTTFPELAASIGSVVPLAAQLNVKQEEMFTGFATLTGVTGNASEVSTQFAAILRAMIKPTTAMSTAIRTLGYESASAMVEQLGMVGSLNALMSTTNGTEEAVAKLFGRAEALTSVFALTGSQAKTFEEKLMQLSNASGMAEQAFKEQTEGVNKAGFEFAKAQQKAIVLAQDLGDTLAPAITDVVIAATPLIEIIKDAVKKFTSLDESTKTAIVKFGLLTAAVGPAMLIMGQTIKTVSAMIGAFRLLSPVLIATTTATKAATVAAEGAKVATVGLNTALLALYGKLAIVAGAVWLVTKSIKDMREGNRLATESFGILGGSVRDLRSQIDMGQAKIQTYTDTVETQRLANQQACQEHQKISSTLTSQAGILDAISSAMDNYTNVINSNTAATIENAKAAEKSLEQVNKYYAAITSSQIVTNSGSVINRSSIKKANELFGSVNRDYINQIANEKGVDIGVATDMAKSLRNEGWKNALKKSGVPSFATGTPYVPRDTLAFVHKGEAIIPARENKRQSSGTMTVIFQMDSREVTRALLPYIPGELARVGVKI